MASMWDFSGGTAPERLSPEESEEMSRNPIAGLDPRLMSGLMQAGLTLMAGPTWGDTGSSLAARAIGSAGEAATAAEAEGLKSRLAEERIGLTGARAQRARALAEGRGVEGTDPKLGESMRRTDLAHAARQSRIYQTEIDGIRRRNADLMKAHRKELGRAQRFGDPPPPAPTLEPIPSFREWQSQHEGRGGGGGGRGGGGGSVPPPAQRIRGQTYPTPQGQLTWTGTGWVKPQGQPQPQATAAAPDVDDDDDDDEDT